MRKANNVAYFIASLLMEDFVVTRIKNIGNYLLEDIGLTVYYIFL